MNSSPLAAMRQASVATSRRALDLAPFQFVGADPQGIDGAAHGLVAASRQSGSSPSPSRTMREKASTTVKPLRHRRRDQQSAIVGSEIEGAIISIAPLGPSGSAVAGCRLSAPGAGSRPPHWSRPRSEPSTGAPRSTATRPEHGKPPEIIALAAVYQLLNAGKAFVSGDARMLDRPLNPKLRRC